MDYIYHGDKLTDLRLKKKPCKAVREPDGKCVRTNTNGAMLVEFEAGERHIIIGRLLRKIK